MNNMKYFKWNMQELSANSACPLFQQLLFQKFLSLSFLPVGIKKKKAGLVHSLTNYKVNHNITNIIWS